MDTLVRWLVTLAFFCNASPGLAGPIVDNELLLGSGINASAGVLGWSNSQGSFAVDHTGTYMATCCNGSYSTSSFLFTQQGGALGVVIDGGVGTPMTSASVNLVALVLGDGTVMGDLLGGVLTMRAGSQGIAALGAAPFETLLVGYAIDSAALPMVGVSMLFNTTYAIPSLAPFDDYLTYVGAYAGAWGTMNGSPWARDWSMTGFTFSDFLPTHRVPEPGSLALLLVGLASVGITFRRAPK